MRGGGRNCGLGAAAEVGLDVPVGCVRPCHNVAPSFFRMLKMWQARHDRLRRRTPRDGRVSRKRKKPRDGSSRIFNSSMFFVNV